MNNLNGLNLRKISTGITVGSVLSILLATLFPDYGQPIPSSLCLACGDLGGVDSVLNIVLFVPLGAGLALYGTPVKRAILLACGLSILIETAQFFFIPGRDASIADVLANTVGAALGFALTRHMGTWLRPSARSAISLLVGWAAMWLAIQTISSFAFTPSLPDSQYYGQLARPLKKTDSFRGRVLTASVGEIAIPNDAFRDSRAVRQRLLDGATVMTTVVPAGETRGVAPVVRVADSEQREITLLAQYELDLLFTLRFGAAALRLRAPLFALPNVFPASEAGRQMTGETVAVSGTYLPGEVRMSARSASEMRRSLVPLTASLGWTLVLPAQWSIEGTLAERVISCIWVAALILPFGYWGAFAVKGLEGKTFASRIVMLSLAGGAAIYAGLVLLPHVYRLSATPVSDWLAALSGLVVGMGVATWWPVHSRRLPTIASQ